MSARKSRSPTSVEERLMCVEESLALMTYLAALLGEVNDVPVSPKVETYAWNAVQRVCEGAMANKRAVLEALPIEATRLDAPDV